MTVSTHVEKLSRTCFFMQIGLGLNHELELLACLKDSRQRGRALVAVPGKDSQLDRYTSKGDT